MSVRFPISPPSTGLRAFVQALVDERFDGNITHAAKALGISHPYLSQYLNERTGAGRKLTRAVASLTGTSLDDLERLGDVESERLAAPPAPPPPPPPPPPPSALPLHAPADRPSDASESEFQGPGEARSLLGWVDAIAEASRKYPSLPLWALRVAGRMGVEPLGIKYADPSLATELARLVWQFINSNDYERLEAEEARNRPMPRVLETQMEEAKPDEYQVLEPLLRDDTLSTTSKLDVETIRLAVRSLLEAGRLVPFEHHKDMSGAPHGPKVLVAREELQIVEDDPSSVASYNKKTRSGLGQPRRRSVPITIYALNKEAQLLVAEHLEQQKGSGST